MGKTGRSGSAYLAAAVLTGRSRHHPNWIVVLVLVTLVSSGLAACGDDSDDDEVITSSAPEVPDNDDDVDMYVHPTGCISFAPAEEWEQVDETGLGVSYSADPENPYSDALGLGPEPGEPGVLVTANCAPLDQVGASGPMGIPGFDLVDDQVVDFGGGEGRLVEYQIERPGVPIHVNLRATVDINDARCTLQVDGNLDAVDTLRDDFDVALGSYRCAGR